jgi:hypothetical protein
MTEQTQAAPTQPTTTTPEGGNTQPAVAAPPTDVTPPVPPAPAEGQKPSESAKPDPAPVEYQPFKLPEGMKLDEDIHTEFKSLAKSKGLSQEDAQGFVDLQTKFVAKQMAQTATEWQTAARNDKEIGGEKFDANLAKANAGIAAVMTPDFVTFLKTSQLGNHPEMIRAFMKVGDLVTADSKFVAPGRPAEVGGFDAKKFYDKSDHN